MNHDIDQTIAALASPPGGALRGIVRISGQNVREVLVGWFHPDDVASWESARSARSHSGRLILDSSNDPIACPVNVLFWPNNRSYTGQPLIELHLPGSPCLLEEVLSESYRRGARAARPGEFTLRAFLAGKMDLLQAEAVLGVIDAQNQVELQTALAQLAGGVSGRLSQLRRDLLELLADLEAGLDFVDEDIEFVSREDVTERLSNGIAFVEELLQQTNDRMQSRVRAKVVLAGLPNAGKSTLFNRLAGSQSALVSPEQGTTRDFLARTIEWGDLSFDLIDTAGWEDRSEGIAAAAQEQRIAQLEQSNLVVWCTSAELNAAEIKLDNELFHCASQQTPNLIRLLTKIDLIERSSWQKVSKAHFKTSFLENKATAESVSDIASVRSEVTLPDFETTTVDLPQFTHISVTTDKGVVAFKELLRDRLTTQTAGMGHWLGMTASRCRETLEATAASLKRASNAAKSKTSGDELIAIDLRDALDQLGMILGVIYTDDILDRIFSKFCIGK